MAGKIVLVGAGPGDPGLLTLKGRRWLERADVVVYDYLANPRLLEHARPEALQLLVGKHGGGSRVEQNVINDMLLTHARAGKLVVRLKGGDPFIFGRGGEEAEAASAAGIEFEIVPGVTSAIAVAAYAGIPLTHRDWASNVVFTTGYEYPDKPELAVHWQDLARKGTTLVILMTQRQLRGNMRQLCDAGRAANTPVAVVQWGTRGLQRTVIGTLATIADLSEGAAMRPPALAIVGEVVQLRQALQWFERKPLFGKRIVVTRPRGQASALTERLEELGADVLELPTIRIAAPESYVALDAALQQPDAYDWLVFTSVNGVHAFVERLRSLHLDLRAWHRARIAAIGTQTAAALAQYALPVEVIPEDFRAEGLRDALGKTAVAGQRFLLPRAAGARPLLPQALQQLGARVDEAIAYRSVSAGPLPEVTRQSLLAGEVDLLTFTSSSTVDNFVALTADLLPSLLPQVEVACIGPITAATAETHGMRVTVQPRQYTIAALVDAIVHHYAAAGGS